MCVAVLTPRSVIDTITVTTLYLALMERGKRHWWLREKEQGSEGARERGERERGSEGKGREGARGKGERERGREGSRGIGGCDEVAMDACSESTEAPAAWSCR